MLNSIDDLSSNIYVEYFKQNLAKEREAFIFYTQNHLKNNEFYIVEEGSYENVGENFKNYGLCITYNKGNKLDLPNQDKFFILISKNVEIFCLLDGHGPFGHDIAESIQNEMFHIISRELDQIVFSEDLKESFTTIFSNVQKFVENDDRDNNYFISGVALTLVIKRKNIIYLANVGNVKCLLFNSSKQISFELECDELSQNHGSLIIENNFNNIVLKEGIFVMRPTRANGR